MSEVLDFKRLDDEWVRYHLKSIDSRLSRIENFISDKSVSPEEVVNNLSDEVNGFRRIMDVILRQHGI